MTSRYPEHEKLSKIVDKSQSIGEFLEWLRFSKGIHLASWLTIEVAAVPEYNWAAYHYDDLAYHGETTTDLLAEFFDIDQDKLEQEKRQMLDEIRAANARREQNEP